MKRPADEAPTKEELEVAQLLHNFPELFLEAESRRIPDFLRWGARRRRSALDDNISLLDPSPPLPPPPPPPPDGNDKRKDGDRGDAGGAATLSPATPFSFPASCSEEPDGRPPRPPCSTPAKKFKKTNRHMEVKEQSQLIASLSDQKVHLQRSIQEYEALYQKLKARNSWLRDLQSKAVRESMAEESQRPRQRQDGSIGLAPLGATTLQSPVTRSLVDPRNQQWEIQPLPAAAVDRIAGGGTKSPSVVAAGLWPEKKSALDLNASPEEEEKEEGEWKRSSAYKAAMSAQARKRRLEIQREKNNHCASSSHPLFSMAHKLPRLR